MKRDPDQKTQPLAKAGLFHSLKILGEFRRDPIAALSDLKRNRGDLVELSLGPKKVMICSHPDHAEEILRRNAEHFRKSRLVFDKIIPLTGRTGLVQLEGEASRAHRALTGKAMTHEALSSAYPLLVASIEVGLKKIDAAARAGREIDLEKHITDIVLRNALILVLGDPSRETDTDGLRDAFLEANRLCGAGIRSLFPLPSFLPTRRNRRLRECIRSIDAAIDSAIRNRKQGSGGKDLLSVLVDSGLDRRQIRDQVVTFLFAGHETTATSLTWTLYLLSRNPHVEEEIRRECAKFSESGAPGFAELRELSLIHSSYQESLRLFPPSWTLAREALQDTRVGGHPVRKGTLLFLGVGQIQKHPAFWDDPERFLPERFLAEEPRHPYAFIPFGGGSRICIGQRAALVEATLFLAMAVPRFRFVPPPGFQPEVEALITAHPKSGFPVRVHRIEGTPA